MGWDYFTYEQQPSWFIDDILTFLGFEVSIQHMKSVEAQQRIELSKPPHG